MKWKLNIIFKPKHHSITSRIMSSTFSNVICGGLGFLTGMFLGRGLGPSPYGQLNFLLTCSAGIRQIVDFGTSQAFYTLIAHKEKPAGIYFWYFRWLVFQFLFLIFITIFLRETGRLDTVWLGISLPLIIMAIGASFMRDRVWATVNCIAESGRKTVAIQFWNVAITLAHFIFVVVLYSIGMLQVGIVLFLILAETFIASIICFKMMKGEIAEQRNLRVPLYDIVNKVKPYCAPLILYTIVGGGVEFMERWMLQKYGGTIQQGLYSMSYLVGSLVMIVSTSMTRVMWKEVAEASASKNDHLAHKYYKTCCHLAFISSASIAGFLTPWVKTILFYAAGEDYTSGYPVIALMIFFFIYQSYGQITGTTLYAISKTRLLAGIGLSSMVLGLVATYFLVGPRNGIIPAFGLGGTGLAIKMVLLALVSTNLQNYYISRFHCWPVDWKYQPRVIIFFLIDGFLSKYLIEKTGGALPDYIEMVCAFCIYGGITFYVLQRWPELLGIKKEDAVRYINYTTFWRK